MASESKVTPAHSYGLTNADLKNFNEDQMRDQNKERLEGKGGVEAVAAALKVDLAHGLKSDEHDLELRGQV